ncbi:acyl-CoA N-acyltransferase [Lipomyces oligophaga]|uniref:acyl-CoA N-acyltransferase n=1 Tax=Lipomyces oligophaga TaxID=45792 RepID=UPI0034D018B2
MTSPGPAVQQPANDESDQVVDGVGTGDGSSTIAANGGTAAIRPGAASSAVAAASAAASVSPPPTSIATLTQLRVGCHVWVHKDGETRLAELLSIVPRKGQPTFYVHYQEFNKRLDEWIKPDRLDLSQPVQWPRPEKPKKGPPGAVSKDTPLSKDRKNRRVRPSKHNKAHPAVKGKENLPKEDKEEDIAVKEETATREDSIDATPDLSQVSEAPAANKDADLMDLDQTHPQMIDSQDDSLFSREEEIKKLRTSGSMTQNVAEVARVRNFMLIQFGKHEIEPWYFSPYPIELTEEDCLHICEFCLSYFGTIKQFQRHRVKCTLQHPPGNEIYRDASVSFFEIDGRRQHTWCRNLCLISKLFLDHKTLYYDVDPFLFYCMTVKDELGHHLIGYFSKEKESADQYNVACILTLPQYQRHGYGRLLIAFSYELSKKEGKLGSPEKPLSDLGLMSYRAYWSDTLTELLIDCYPETRDITIDELATRTSMTTQDILHTLQTLNMLKYYKGQHIICLTNSVIEHNELMKKKRRRRIDPSKLLWKPPVFTPAQLRFAW